MTTPFRSMPEPDRELSGKFAICGLGESDFHADYVGSRTKPPGYELPTPESLALTAFERALADSGLNRSDIDGLSLSFLYGGPSPSEMASLMGIAPVHLGQASGILAGPIPAACAAIAAGKCKTIALVYAVAARAIGRVFGGQVHADQGGTPSSYYYHHPWGWSSQAAHWAMAWQHYMARFGKSEADMAALAICIRDHARANPNATMQQALTVEQYLASRYIVEPLHLYDMCLVNDGAVCLILTTSDHARDLARPPVLVGGWGDAKVKQDKLDALVRQRLRPQFQAAGGAALAMAGLELADIGQFEGYDAATMHLVNHIEGHGFVEEGSALDACKAGAFEIGGSIPVNVGGGMLSGAYMHGWSHVAEIVRQLRGEAEARQIAGLNAAMFSLAQTDQVHPLVFTRA